MFHKRQREKLHADGALRWRYATKVGVSAPVAIGLDGTIYGHAAIFGTTSLYGISALLPNGALAWEYRTGARGNAAPAIGADGTIYVAGLHALTPTGTLQWTYRTRGEILHMALGADGTIYAVSQEDFAAVPGSGHARIYALRRDGSLRWKYDCGGAYASGLAIAGDGTIYAAVAPGLIVDEPQVGTVHAIGRDGHRIWRYEAGAMFVGPPVIGRNGNLYFGLDTGYLCALGQVQTAVGRGSGSPPPPEYALFQNVPNPVNSSTVIRFCLPEPGEAEVVVYDLAGQRVAMLDRGWQQAGTHTVTWDGRDEDSAPVATGVYVYRLRAGPHTGSRRLLMVR